MKAISLLALLAMPLFARAQTAPSVGIGTTAPDASAALDITSAAQRLAIGTPATGLLLYQTDGAHRACYSHRPLHRAQSPGSGHCPFFAAPHPIRVDELFFPPRPAGAGGPGPTGARRGPCRCLGYPRHSLRGARPAGTAPNLTDRLLLFPSKKWHSITPGATAVKCTGISGLH